MDSNDIENRIKELEIEQERLRKKLKNRIDENSKENNKEDSFIITTENLSK